MGIFEADFWASLLEKHGAIVVVLGVLSFMFWSLIWKVWDAAMKSKDAEIERLVKERDKYQAIVFPRLLSSDWNPPGAGDGAEGK